MFFQTRIFVATLFLLPSLARADEPLSQPEKIFVCSPSGSVCANSDPTANSTTIFRKYGAKTLWSIEGWHRWLFVADDGGAIAVAYNGMNLVPPNSDLQLEVLHFYNHGKLVRSIKLADLYIDKSQLMRTVSHFAWVLSIHINRANQLVVELVSGQRLAFDMSSGELRVQIPDDS